MIDKNYISRANADIRKTDEYTCDLYKEIVKKISNQYDDDLLNMFLKFGFDKEYLINHANEFMVFEQGNLKRYTHNGKDLFDVITRAELDNNGYIINYITEFIPLT